ncbi:hypothetical protein TPA0598_17_00070 [Streptomyces lydicamycinicus]|uniref:Helix-turn-helix domain-containing protein n=1 Tax=Streptomyces lydicamycinicus TaxID=1546107 RepID=A0A0P4RI08_9ACTN|nr:hypothetical protein TPA0598_17_00070 [Streptomyces lydicamycinicus]
MVWVLSGDAPVADVNEYAVLGAMADKADSDGCGTWLSKETIAARVHVSEETVKRCWRNMSRRRLIARGDQRMVRHYRADRRPVVWDILIPFDWFSNVDRINADRARHGLPPLTAADRPPIAPAPKKAGRADKGKPRPKKKTAAEQESPGRGNSETPRPGDSPKPDGGTTSSRRGNCKSSAGELEDPQHSQSNQSPDSGRDDTPSVRPSVQEGDASETDGRTDGGSGIEGQGGTAPGAGRELPPDHALERTPGVEVLAAIGAEAPEWKIIGTCLRDQGRSATLLLERGFTPQEIRHALLSRPLPQPLTHTVAAVIGGRLRELAMSLPAFGVRPIPEQAGPVLRERCTTLAAERTKDEALERRVMRECATCQAPIGGDADLCAECSGRAKPLCDAGCGRAVLADGLVCLSCDVPPDDIGVCPGHDVACGRPVVSQGLCRHCLISAEQQRAAREREYEDQVAAAVAAVAATEGQWGA